MTKNTNFCYDCDQEVILYYTNCCKLRQGGIPIIAIWTAMRDRRKSSVLRYLPEVPAAGRRTTTCVRSMLLGWRHD